MNENYYLLEFWLLFEDESLHNDINKDEEIGKLLHHTLRISLFSRKVFRRPLSPLLPFISIFHLHFY